MKATPTIVTDLTNISKAKENNFTNSKRRWASVLMRIKWIIHRARITKVWLVKNQKNNQT